MTLLVLQFMLTQSGISPVPSNYFIPNIEIWVTLFGIFVTLGLALVGMWVKINSEVAVLKSEYATLREMVREQTQVDKQLVQGVNEVKESIAQLRGELMAKQDK